MAINKHLTGMRKLPIIGTTQLSALMFSIISMRITYNVSIIYGVHGNNGGVKSTRNSLSNFGIMLQRVSFGR